VAFGLLDLSNDGFVEVSEVESLLALLEVEGLWGAGKGDQQAAAAADAAKAAAARGGTELDVDTSAENSETDADDGASFLSSAASERFARLSLDVAEGSALALALAEEGPDSDAEEDPFASLGPARGDEEDGDEEDGDEEDGDEGVDDGDFGDEEDEDSEDDEDEEPDRLESGGNGNDAGAALLAGRRERGAHRLSLQERHTNARGAGEKGAGVGAQVGKRETGGGGRLAQGARGKRSSWYGQGPKAKKAKKAKVVTKNRRRELADLAATRGMLEQLVSMGQVSERRGLAFDSFR
jgi:hypothetical protein